MALIVADSDVLIDALRGREPSARRISTALRSGSLGTTVVNVFELASGAKSKAERSKVEILLAAMIVLPMSVGAANQAASVRRHLESRGQSIGMADYLIAGICLDRGTPLLTRNRAHFERVPALRLASFEAD